MSPQTEDSHQDTKQMGLDRFKRFSLILFIAAIGFFVYVILSLIFLRYQLPTVSYLSILLASFASLALLLSYAYVQRRILKDSDEGGGETHDIADLEKQIEELKSSITESDQAAEQFRKVSRFRSKFIADMSHDLRTPLNSIIGYSELLIDDVGESLDEMALEDLNAIHSSGQQLLEMLNNIFDISKLEADLIYLNAKSVVLNELLPPIIKKAHDRLEDKEDVELIIELPDDLPPVATDSIRFQQIIWNLMSNAIKFTEKGYVKLKVWADGTWLYLDVEDTGKGIPESEIGLIFDRFRKGNGDANAKLSDAGLGLAITHQLVLLHKGEISASSESSKGTTFSVKLPLTQED